MHEPTPTSFSLSGFSTFFLSLCYWHAWCVFMKHFHVLWLYVKPFIIIMLTQISASHSQGTYAVLNTSKTIFFKSRNGLDKKRKSSGPLSEKCGIFGKEVFFVVLFVKCSDSTYYVVPSKRHWTWREVAMVGGVFVGCFSSSDITWKD